MKERAFDEGVGRCTGHSWWETNQQDKTFQAKNRDEATSGNDIKVGIAHLFYMDSWNKENWSIIQHGAILRACLNLFRLLIP